MRKVLILFAHPTLEKSRVNKALIKEIRKIPEVTFQDLYELYPDFYIDVPLEQKMLLEHDTIIMQHPLFWYNIPPLLKQWIDLVLEHGWAYGAEGNALKGKNLINVMTAGGGEQAYQVEGYNKYTIKQFLAPLERTAALCKMNYLPPFVVHGTHRLDDAAIAGYSALYSSFLRYILNEDNLLPAYDAMEYINDAVKGGEANG